jgi:hypothetical protein
MSWLVVLVAMNDEIVELDAGNLSVTQIKQRPPNHRQDARGPGRQSTRTARVARLARQVENPLK